MCMKPKDALSVKKEHDQTAGMLFKATEATVKLPLPRTTAFAAPSSSNERAMYIYFCLFGTEISAWHIVSA